MNNKLAFFSNKSDITTLTGKLPETEADKNVLVNAIMSPGHALSDMVNMEIPMVNFYMEKVEVNREDEDGNMQSREGVRTVIIDQNGDSYACMSVGICNSIRTICNFYGTPDTWDAPIMVQVKQVNKGKNRVLTLIVTQ